MRRLGIAIAFATTALATPAAARDGAMYIGVEGGPMIIENMEYGLVVNGFDRQRITINPNTGFDVDAIAGYDFGMFRAEGEVGYKRASIDEFRLVGQQADDDPKGRTTALSAMLNLLLDIGPEDGVRGYLGGGIGFAKVKVRAEAPNFVIDGSDSGFAWQAIAGLGFPLSDNLELGMKYRYFNARKFDISDTSGSFCGSVSATVCATVPAVAEGGRWRSHSLLASLIYNFGAPAVVEEIVPPPPPPPPPPPATQTCPDGSVILATEVCPAPPPPPPPPPPAPERG